MIIDVNVLWFPEWDVRFLAASDSQDQRARPLFVSGATRVGFKDFCGADEIDG